MAGLKNLCMLNKLPLFLVIFASESQFPMLVGIYFQQGSPYPSTVKLCEGSSPPLPAPRHTAASMQHNGTSPHLPPPVARSTNQRAAGAAAGPIRARLAGSWAAAPPADTLFMLVNEMMSCKIIHAAPPAAAEVA